MGRDSGFGDHLACVHWIYRIHIFIRTVILALEFRSMLFGHAFCIALEHGADVLLPTASAMALMLLVPLLSRHGSHVR